MAASRPEPPSRISPPTGSARCAAPARPTSPRTRTDLQLSAVGDQPSRVRASVRQPPLELLVFVTGTASLGSEIAAARLIAPFFGASTIVWANTIAVVLVALSIGYWFGGRLGDRHPGPRALSVLVLIAAALLAVVPIVAGPFL